MKSATRLTVVTFGVLAAAAGIEHGIGEVLQGNVAPEGWIIESWAGSDLFRIQAGEPALTLIPNLLVSGILSIFVSLLLLVWVIGFVHRKHGPLILLGLSLVLLLVGGGFGPPLLGLILAVVATRINAPLAWWRTHLSPGVGRILARLWPWSFSGALIAWLFLFPVSIILDYFVGLGNADIVISVTILAAFSLLLLTIFAGFAYDLQEKDRIAWTPATSR